MACRVDFWYNQIARLLANKHLSYSWPVRPMVLYLSQTRQYANTSLIHSYHVLLPPSTASAHFSFSSVQFVATCKSACSQPGMFWLGTAHVTTQSAFLLQQSLAVLHLSPSGLQAGTRLAVTDIIDAVNAIIMAGKKKRIVCLGWYDLLRYSNDLFESEIGGRWWQ